MYIKFSLNTFSSKSGKGERLIVLHVGGKDGWVSGEQIALIIFNVTMFLLKVVIGFLNLRKVLQLITTKK